MVEWTRRTCGSEHGVSVLLRASGERDAECLFCTLHVVRAIHRAKTSTFG